jgi:hypothetical protein
LAFEFELPHLVNLPGSFWKGPKSTVRLKASFIDTFDGVINGLVSGSAKKVLHREMVVVPIAG